MSRSGMARIRWCRCVKSRPGPARLGRGAYCSGTGGEGKSSCIFSEAAAHMQAIDQPKTRPAENIPMAMTATVTIWRATSACKF
jgi:hypothetical protein